MTLFAHTHTRLGHPATSYEAARKAERTATEHEERLVAYLTVCGPTMASELPEHLRKRCAGAAGKGLVERAGVGVNRNGNKSTIWKVVCRG